MKKRTKYTPTQRAAEYLKRVAALTEAEQVRGDSYWLRAGRRNFLVDYEFVRVISHHGKSTCFSVAADPDMPSAEVVASALLPIRDCLRNGENSEDLRSRRMARCLETHIS